MDKIDAEPLIDSSFSQLVSALAGRLEFPARFDRRREHFQESIDREGRRESRERTARKDFERAWKTY